MLPGRRRSFWRTLPPVKRSLLIQRLKLPARVLVTLLLLGLVFGRVDFGEVWAILAGSQPAWLLAALLAYFTSFVLSSVRSGRYLADVGIRLPFAEGLRLYLLGTVGNIALPGGVGGDGYKTLRLRQAHGVPAKRILTAFLFERLSGLWAIGAWLAVLSYRIPALPFRGMPLLAAFTAGSLAYAAVLKRFFPGQAAGMLPKHLLSIAIQGLVSLSVLCILAAQPRPFSPAAFLFGFHASTVVSILNVGLSGLGVREFVMGYSAAWLGNDAPLSVFTASAFWLVSTAATLPGFWVIWRQGPAPLDDKTSPAEA
jgi:uncharacterized membrane protein YbhN (UPF0104 family)